MSDSESKQITKTDFINLQKEWESIEFNPDSGKDSSRQSDILKIMSDSPWMFDMDTGEVVNV